MRMRRLVQKGKIVDEREIVFDASADRQRVVEIARQAREGPAHDFDASPTSDFIAHRSD